MTSQSIKGRDFTDFEMLDAKIASALKRIISNRHFRRRVGVEEQTAQKYERFLRGRQIACMIYDHVRRSRPIRSFHSFLRREMTFRISIHQALLSACEVPRENILEGLYVQVEDTRFCSASYYQRFKTMVRRHSDQMVTTPNYKARNEWIEIGVSVKSHKREDRGYKAESSSLVPKTQTQIDGRKPRKVLAPEESFSARKGENACKNLLKGTCTNSSYDTNAPNLGQTLKILWYFLNEICTDTHL